MKQSLYIIILSIILFLISCKDNSISFGTVEYYPDFLWVDANIKPVSKTFVFDFSEDAKNDSHSFAEFQFVDNNGNPISTEVMQVYDKGEQLKENKLRVGSEVDSKMLTFQFSPNAKSGKYQGYLKLINHRLDRLDSQPLRAGQKVDAFQWTLYFEKGKNPLAKGLMWLAIILGGLLFFWFSVLKRIFYPRIRLTRMELSSKKGYYVNKKINGARKVIISNKRNKQSFLNKLFTGEILYIVNEIWTSPWDLSPKDRKKVAKINLHGKYMITPITSELANYGEYQLTNIDTKESITLKIL